MKLFLASIMLALIAICAYAETPTDVATRMMGVAEERWSDTAPYTGRDYFDHLKQDFSKSFVRLYKKTGKVASAYDDSEDPFDYDVIVSGQDGCPLKDIQITAAPELKGVTVVEASFKAWTCFDTSERNRVNRVRFDIVTEKGRPVIQDIHAWDHNLKEWNSLVENMKNILSFH